MAARAKGGQRAESTILAMCLQRCHFTSWGVSAKVMLTLSLGLVPALCTEPPRQLCHAQAVNLLHLHSEGSEFRERAPGGAGKILQK